MDTNQILPSDPQVIEADGLDIIEIPGTNWLMSADFIRDGDDLYLVGKEGQKFLITDYFADDTPPDLKTASGAVLKAETVEKLAELDLVAAEPLLQRAEVALDEHDFAAYMFDGHKPVHTRHAVQPLTTDVDALLKSLSRVDWRSAEMLRDFGADVSKLRHELEALQRAAPAVLTNIEGMPSPRRETFTARNNVTIPELGKIFKRFAHCDSESETESEFLDRMENFVASALNAAEIPCPAVRDTSLGEHNQGRLRKMLKR